MLILPWTDVRKNKACLAFLKYVIFYFGEGYLTKMKNFWDNCKSFSLNFNL